MRERTARAPSGRAPTERRARAAAPRSVGELHALAAGVDRPWARAAALLLVLALAAAFAWRVEASYDFPYHVVTGRWILEHHAWPRLDPFTYTASDHPYIDMHGLFQIALAVAYRAGGLAAIGALREVLVLATLALVWAVTRRRGVRSPEVLALGFGLAICAWEGRFFARPELATTLFLALELYLLRRHSEDGRAGWLYALVPLQWVWTLSHAFSLFGLAVLGLYALTSSLPPARGASPGRAPWLAVAASAGVMILNPYGFSGIAFLWALRTRIERGNVFAETITELASPFGAIPVLFLMAFKILFVLSLVALILRIHRLSWFDRALVAMFGVLSATRMRNVGLFAIAVLPIALEAASECVGILAASARWFARVRRPAGAVLALALPIVAETVVSGSYYARDFRSERFGFEQTPATYPIRTVNTIEAHGMQARIYNDLRYGGYLIQRLWPRQKVFVDARLEVIGDALYLESLAIGSGRGWRQAVARRGFDLALVSHESKGLVLEIDADTSWALVDADGEAMLFMRRSPERRTVIAAAESAWRALNAPAAPGEPALLPGPRQPALTRFLGRKRFAWEAWGRGNAMALMGWFEAARREYGRALRESDYEEPLLVQVYARTLFYGLDRREEALPWARRLVELLPRYREARDMLSQLMEPSAASGQSPPAPAGSRR